MGKSIVIALVLLLFCLANGNLTASAQSVTISTGRAAETTKPDRKHTPVRKNVHRTPRASTSGGSLGPAAQQSENFVNLGDEFAEKSKWRAAEAAYKEAISLSPGNADAYAALGTLYNDQGKHGDAFSPLNRARAIDPSNALSAYGLGYAYMRGGRYNDAVSFFKQAINADPNFAQAYFDLGLTYLSLSNKQAALTQHDKLATLDAALAKELLAEINKK